MPQSESWTRGWNDRYDGKPPDPAFVEDPEYMDGHLTADAEYLDFDRHGERRHEYPQVGGGDEPQM